MNLNDRFTVTMTDYGLELYRQHFRGVAEKCGNPVIHENVGPIFDCCLKRTDKVLTETLWELMSIFGHKMMMGGATIFEKNNMVSSVACPTCARLQQELLDLKQSLSVEEEKGESK